MKKPNFFILGAPKCGTTSLARWLNLHPNIFMSEPKEPHYFNTDSNHRDRRSLEDYEKLFQQANQDHTVVGEASVWYLTSADAITNILDYSENPKFVVCVRNPILAAVSLHDQKRYSGDENIGDFNDAWCAQETRLTDPTYKTSATCNDTNHLQYGANCKFGELITKVTSQVNPNALKVIIFDDIVSKPAEVLRELEDFLDVQHFENYEFVHHNTAKRRRSMMLAKTHKLLSQVKRKLNIKKEYGIAAAVNKWNAVERERPLLSNSLYTELANYFEEDIKLLETLTDRDFSSWRQQQPPKSTHKTED